MKKENDNGKNTINSMTYLNSTIDRPFQMMVLHLILKGNRSFNKLLEEVGGENKRSELSGTIGLFKLHGLISVVPVEGVKGVKHFYESSELAHEFETYIKLKAELGRKLLEHRKNNL